MIVTSTKSAHLVSLEILIRTETLHIEEGTCEVPGRNGCLKPGGMILEP